MTRTYELGFIVEPRQNDDEVQAITDRFTGMLEDAGSTVTYIDHWGKRKLAYPIRKFQEGKYVFVYVSSENVTPPWPDIERLMMQDEKILRFLVVRTDEDLKRAERKGKVKPAKPGADKEAEEAAAAEAAKEAEAKDAPADKADDAPAEKAEATAETAEAPAEKAAEAPAEDAAAEAPAEESTADAADEADKAEGDA